MFDAFIFFRCLLIFIKSRFIFYLGFEIFVTNSCFILWMNVMRIWSIGGVTRCVYTGYSRGICLLLDWIRIRMMREFCLLTLN